MTGEDLKTWRKRLDLTQEDLVKALDVTRMTVSRWENNDVAIPKAVELALKQIESQHAKKKA